MTSEAKKFMDFETIETMRNEIEEKRSKNVSVEIQSIKKQIVDLNKDLLEAEKAGDKATAALIKRDKDTLLRDLQCKRELEEINADAELDALDQIESYLMPAQTQTSPAPVQVDSTMQIFDDENQKATIKVCNEGKMFNAVCASVCLVLFTLFLIYISTH